MWFQKSQTRQSSLDGQRASVAVGCSGISEKQLSLSSDCASKRSGVQKLNADIVVVSDCENVILSSLRVAAIVAKHYPFDGGSIRHNQNID